MSIVVENLGKQYGGRKAIDEISFHAPPGTITGLLGPNGAGKSTTMKILTCYISYDCGSGEICGYDLKKESMQARAKTGYLPEHNPLYKDMYVKEFLNFAADLRQVTDKKKRVEDLINITGLKSEASKKIKELSKGYRQRVGLAQTLINDPEVLILDEPTTGLDPNQILEIRNLIKETGIHKTVILSTHIMQEVEAVCDRLIIINKGRIVAQGTISEIKSLMKGAFNFYFEFKEDPVYGLIDRVQGIISCGRSPLRKGWNITADRDIRADIFELAKSNNLILMEIRKEENSLEDIFKSLTLENQHTHTP